MAKTKPVTDKEKELSDYIDNLDKIILDKIEQTRIEKGISQAKLAQVIGVSQNTYKLIKDGEMNLTHKRMIVLLKYLEIENPFSGNQEHDLFNILKSLDSAKDNLKSFKAELVDMVKLIDFLIKPASEEIDGNKRTLQLNMKATEKEKSFIDSFQDEYNKAENKNLSRIDILMKLAKEEKERRKL